jgi:hypothetical protein
MLLWQLHKSGVRNHAGAGMQIPHLQARGSVPRRRSTLAGCLAVGLGLGAADPAQAFTTYVNTCADIGTHPKGVIALRYAAISAGDGDIIDLSTLNCVITLNAANIPIGQQPHDPEFGGQPDHDRRRSRQPRVQSHWNRHARVPLRDDRKR